MVPRRASAASPCARSPEGCGTSYSGSVIGLVTFGDEVIGFEDVISDQASIHAPEWEVNTEHVPPPGTEVTVIVKKKEEASNLKLLITFHEAGKPRALEVYLWEKPTSD